MRFSIERIFGLKDLLRELGIVLRRLSFEDNFAADTVQVTLNAGEEVEVAHNLQSIPTYYIIGGQSAQGQIIDGQQQWTAESIFLKNTGTNKITAKVIIME